MKKVIYISGGVGGAKFAKGLNKIENIDLTILVNTGDDEHIHGVFLSPDIDTVIYNLAGIQVHHPFNNVLLSSNGNLKWDGLDSNGIKLSIGNYILLIEAFNETGKIIKRKIAFGITGIF